MEQHKNALGVGEQQKQGLNPMQHIAALEKLGVKVDTI